MHNNFAIGLAAIALATPCAAETISKCNGFEAPVIDPQAGIAAARSPDNRIVSIIYSKLVVESAPGKSGANSVSQSLTLPLAPGGCEARVLVFVRGLCTARHVNTAGPKIWFGWAGAGREFKPKCSARGEDYIVQFTAPAKSAGEMKLNAGAALVKSSSDTLLTVDTIDLSLVPRHER